MKRRGLLASTAVAALAPATLRAQQKSMPVIGSLNFGSSAPNAPYTAAFWQALNEAGFFEGKNAKIENRWADERADRVPAMAADLIERKVDVIQTSGGLIPIRTAQSLTSTIPIVFAIGGDPVAAGFVASFNRPGGNLTGVAYLTDELYPKRLELLSQMVPKKRGVALLVNPHDPRSDGTIRGMEEVARSSGRHLVILKAGSEAELDAAFASLVEPHESALIVTAGNFYNRRREQIVTLAARYGVPTVYPSTQFVLAGGLMSYGASLTGLFHQVGVHTAKILKGAMAAELPVVQPTAFDLTLNMKTAKALGIEVPASISFLATEVIE